MQSVIMRLFFSKNAKFSCLMKTGLFFLSQRTMVHTLSGEISLVNGKTSSRFHSCKQLDNCPCSIVWIFIKIFNSNETGKYFLFLFHIFCWCWQQSLFYKINTVWVFSLVEIIQQRQHSEKVKTFFKRNGVW